MNFSRAHIGVDFEGLRAGFLQFRPEQVHAVLARAGQRLSLQDLAVLLSPAADSFLETMARLSHSLTLRRFGRTMQLYAPLYLSNACSNVCTYCGFSAENRIRRKVLSPVEIGREAAILREQGFQHLLLVTGEAGHVGVDYLEAALQQVRPHFANLSLEVQPLCTADYRRLVQAGASSVLVYQETYDQKAYHRHHLSGPKADMAWRLDTPDRLGEAGLHKIGLGVLYGLSDWRTETLCLGRHLRHVEQHHWKTRTSISFPRLRPHVGGVPGLTAFSERNLVHAACALRLFSHESELSLSTRESPHFRRNAVRLGFTHMSAGSKTNPGGYAAQEQSLEQFAIHDERTPAEVAGDLVAAGYEPVWKDWDACLDSTIPQCATAHSA